MNDNFTTRYFEGHPRANAWVWEYEDGHRTLLSYGTIVADCDPNGWVKVYVLSSATTRKHIGWFMRELGLTYQTAKKIFEEAAALNIHTGEMVDMYEV